MKGAAKKAVAAKDNRDRLSLMADVAKGFMVARPAIEVVRSVEAVPTIFPDFDRTVKIGGWPLARMGLVHGESAEGKSPFVIGIGRSFLERGHFFLWGDFERATDEKWMRALMGPTWGHPGFSALDPLVYTYEKVRGAHRDWAERIANARARGDLPSDTSGVFCIDSIRKLVPERIWEELRKAVKADEAESPKKKSRFAKGKTGMDGVNGRAGQLKAAMNAVWSDELVPLLAATNTSIAVIARETVDPEGEIKIGGGSALLYESALWNRVTSTPIITDDEQRRRLGDKHTVLIRRSKVSARTEMFEEAYFHTSNGVDAPLGFDRSRDLLQVATDVGLLELAGSWYSFGGEKIGQGRDKALAWVRERESEVEAEVRKRIS